jgi:hypothetical protein
MGLRADVVRPHLLALPPLRRGSLPVRDSAHLKGSAQRAAIGLVAVFFVVLLSPLLFDLVTPVLAR